MYYYIFYVRDFKKDKISKQRNLNFGRQILLQFWCCFSLLNFSEGNEIMILNFRTFSNNIIILSYDESLINLTSYDVIIS